MANRVSDAEVKEIIDTDVTDTTAFIKAANLIVTEKLGDQSLGSALLREIERWLAAHLLSARDPRIKSEGTGDGKATYFGKDGLGLDATLYGQNVKALDPTGILANLGKRRASVEVIEVDLGVTETED